MKVPLIFMALLLIPAAFAQEIPLEAAIGVDIRTNNGTAIIEIGDSINIIDCSAKTHNTFTVVTEAKDAKELCTAELRKADWQIANHREAANIGKLQNEMLQKKISELEEEKRQNPIKTSYLFLTTTMAAIFLTTSLALYFRNKNTAEMKK